MKRILLCCLMLTSVSTLSAKLMSAKWETSPRAPLYVGQAYELTLTLETQQDEEIAGVRLEQGPKVRPNEQSSVIKNGRRYTTLHWQQQESAPKIVSIPAGRIQADVTLVQVFGFMRTANTTSQVVSAPALSYEVVPLPGDARGLPIGLFDLQLAADQSTFLPGEVRLITATLTAREGYVPSDYAFEWADTAFGEVYPFRVKERTNKQLIAEAHVVISSETDVSLCLKPLRAFNLATRTATMVNCAPLSLKVGAPESATTEDMTLSIDTASAVNPGAPLRFAPTEGAPIIGALTTPYQVLETRDTWVRVQTPSGAGWIRRSALKE